MLLVGTIALVALVIAVDPANVGRALAGADPRILALMLPCVLLLYLAHGIAWWIALRSAGVEIGFRRAVTLTYVSQMFTFLPGGDLWRVPLVESGRDRRAQVGVVTGTVVFDDLVYFGVLTLGMIPAAVRAPLLVLPLGLTLLPQALIFAILLWPRLYHFLARLVTGLPPLRRFEVQVQLIGPTFRRLVRPRVLVPVLLLDTIAALLATTLFGLALGGVHAPGIGATQVAFTYSLGQVGSSLTVLPAALGIYEGLMTGMIAAQGVAPAVAAVAALLYRAFNDILMAGVGAAVAIWLRRRDRRRPLGPDAEDAEMAPRLDPAADGSPCG